MVVAPMASQDRQVSAGVPFPLVGRVVCGLDDDLPAPILGVIVEQLDDDYVRVAWGCYSLHDVPEGAVLLREALDELRPRS
jgi:hypothetical protein